MAIFDFVEYYLRLIFIKITRKATKRLILEAKLNNMFNRTYTIKHSSSGYKFVKNSNYGNKKRINI